MTPHWRLNQPTALSIWTFRTEGNPSAAEPMVGTGMLAEETTQRKQKEVVPFWPEVRGLFQISSVKYWIARCLAWEYDNAPKDASFFCFDKEQ